MALTNNPSLGLSATSPAYPMPSYRNFLQVDLKSRNPKLKADAWWAQVSRMPAARPGRLAPVRALRVGLCYIFHVEINSKQDAIKNNGTTRIYMSPKSITLDF
jgi:hypothetical protein